MYFTYAFMFLIAYKLFFRTMETAVFELSAFHAVTEVQMFVTGTDSSRKGTLILTLN